MTSTIVKEKEAMDKDGICQSEKRAKVEAASKTLPIWKYFTHDKKPNSQKKRNKAPKES